MKINDLIGAELDRAVAIYQNVEINARVIYSPSTQWAQGGPIIERARLELHNATDRSGEWVAHSDFQIYAFGPTPLIAAMRCYVAAQRLGAAL